MAVARVTELSCTSDKSFEDAINQGITRATQTLRHLKAAWIKEQRVLIENDKITGFQVNLLITFVLDEPGA